MSATLLQLVQQASVEVGLNSPSTVVGNPDNNVVQMLGLINAAGYEIVRQHEWQALNKTNLFQTNFTTTTGTVTSGSAVITGIPSTAGLSARYQVTGTGILPCHPCRIRHQSSMLPSQQHIRPFGQLM